MLSFTDSHAEWRALDEAARKTGCRAARLAAEQARIALSHHPAVNRARGQMTAAAQRQRHDEKAAGR